MYLVGNPSNRHFVVFGKSKSVPLPDLIPVRDEPEDIQTAPDDITQYGSGIKSIKNKLQHINLHSGKKKYEKFVGLNVKK